MNVQFKMYGIIIYHSVSALHGLHDRTSGPNRLQWRFADSWTAHWTVWSRTSWIFPSLSLRMISFIQQNFFPFRQKLNHFRCANEILRDRKMSPIGAFFIFWRRFRSTFSAARENKEENYIKRGLSHTLLSPFSHFFLSFASFFVSKTVYQNTKPSPNSKQKV